MLRKIFFTAGVTLPVGLFTAWIGQAAFAQALPAPAKAKPTAAAHSHGRAKLRVATDGNLLTLEFESPLENLVGFEHAPRNDKQKAALQGMAEALRKADAHLLLRTRDTPSQRTLPRADRLANLVGAFAVEPLRAAQLRGKKVVLIDDVMTSGASLRAAALPLRQAGVRRVTALVFARAETTQ